MAKEELQLDLDNNEELIEVSKPEVKEKAKRNTNKRQENVTETTPVNPLRNERIIVRYISRPTNLVQNPRHILYGGMAENAVHTLVVPQLSSGMFVNILTDNEKAYLEEIMQLEYNALSIYKKENNFWDSSNSTGISKVRLTKQDTYLDLSNPEDYIRYKILLANKDMIAPSLQALQDMPKASYKYVLISEGDEDKAANRQMNATMESYMEFGKISEDVATLRVIVETLDGRPTAPNVKLEFLKNKVNQLIQGDSKMFLKVIKDPLLQTKVIIKKAIEGGIISKRGDYLYLRSDNSPLCEINEEPTLNIAARYLSSPRHQDLLFTIQAKLKQ